MEHKFIPGIIKTETIERKKFDTIEEGVSFVLGLINRQARSIEEVYKSLYEEQVKSNYVIKTCLRLLSDKFHKYGMEISYDDLIRDARAITDKDWPRVKKEVAQILAARKAAVDELIKSAQTSAPEEDKTNKEG